MRLAVAHDSSAQVGVFLMGKSADHVFPVGRFAF